MKGENERTQGFHPFLALTGRLRSRLPSEMATESEPSVAEPEQREERMAQRGEQVQKLREAVEAQGRKQFTSEDIASESGLEQRKVTVQLAAETKAGRVKRIKTGVYQKAGNGVSPNGSDAPKAARAAKARRKAVRKAPARKAPRARKVARKVPSVGLRACLPGEQALLNVLASETGSQLATEDRGFLVQDRAGELWVARRLKVKVG